MLIKDAQSSHSAGASEVKWEWIDTTFRHQEIKVCNALSLVLPACSEWQCTTLSLYLAVGRGTGKIKSGGASYTFTLFLTATDAWLPSIALSQLKIIHKHEASSPAGKGAPISPGGCQYLSHKNPMDHTHRKVNYMPVLSTLRTLLEFALTQRIKKRCETEEGILKMLRDFWGLYRDWKIGC